MRAIPRILAVGLLPVVTAASGIAINFATDLKNDAIAWLAVIILTVAGIGISLAIDRINERSRNTARKAENEPAVSEVRNEVSGSIGGNLVQGRDIAGGIHFRGRQRPPRDGH
ncbi:hypothetical protein [Nocardia mexicana]|uniref:hypothetical protein n=1 Tax=Nocardia mexicana TaxID=279262 RepID=UPI0011C05607|nr:hypothetical protein [Nocardia mexicana]